MNRRAAMGLGLGSAFFPWGGLSLAGPDEAYRAEILRWRQAREESLKGKGGWLSVAGLFWLKEGRNTFGSAPDNDIVLPAGAAPLRAGSFELHAERVVVALANGVEARIAGERADGRELRSDATSAPDVMILGRLSLYVIRRGERLAIRLKDEESAARKAFTRLSWFEVEETARVRARFVPYDKPKLVRVPNVLGRSEEMPSPGYCAFEWGGREVRLSGVFEEEGAEELFFIFRDETSGKETYPAGRFLYSELPKEGVVTLDFNKAYNPPCAFTAFATCPLPPPENWLPVSVSAGEKRYGH